MNQNGPVQNVSLLFIFMSFCLFQSQIVLQSFFAFLLLALWRMTCNLFCEISFHLSLCLRTIRFRLCIFGKNMMHLVRCLHGCPPHLTQVPHQTSSHSIPYCEHPPYPAQALTLCSGLPPLPSFPPYTSASFAQGLPTCFWTVSGTEREGNERKD